MSLLIYRASGDAVYVPIPVNGGDSDEEHDKPKAESPVARAYQAHLRTFNDVTSSTKWSPSASPLSKFESNRSASRDQRHEPSSSSRDPAPACLNDQSFRANGDPIQEMASQPIQNHLGGSLSASLNNKGVKSKPQASGKDIGGNQAGSSSVSCSSKIEGAQSPETEDDAQHKRKDRKKTSKKEPNSSLRESSVDDKKLPQFWTEKAAAQLDLHNGHLLGDLRDAIQTSSSSATASCSGDDLSCEAGMNANDDGLTPNFGKSFFGEEFSAFKENLALKRVMSGKMKSLDDSCLQNKHDLPPVGGAIGDTKLPFGTVPSEPVLTKPRRSFQGPLMMGGKGEKTDDEALCTSFVNKNETGERETAAISKDTNGTREERVLNRSSVGQQDQWRLASDTVKTQKPLDLELSDEEHLDDYGPLDISDLDGSQITDDDANHSKDTNQSRRGSGYSNVDRDDQREFNDGFSKKSGESHGANQRDPLTELFARDEDLKHILPPEDCDITVGEARNYVADYISVLDNLKVPPKLCFLVNIDTAEILPDSLPLRTVGFCALLVIQTKDYLNNGELDSLCVALLNEEDYDKCVEIVYHMSDEELNSHTTFDKDVQTHLLYDITRNTKTPSAKTNQALAVVGSGRFRFPPCDKTHGRDGYYDNILVAVIRVLGWSHATPGLNKKLVKICSLVLESPYTDKLDLLVNKLSDVNETALMLSVRCKNVELFEVILDAAVKYGCAKQLLDIRETIGGKETAFLFAAREGCPEIFAFMLKHKRKFGIDVNQKSEYGLNAFLFAASNSQVEICKMLMNDEEFTGVNDTCRDNCNAFLYACSHYGSIDMCRLLVESKIRTVNENNAESNTRGDMPNAAGGHGGGDNTTDAHHHPGPQWRPMGHHARVGGGARLFHRVGNILNNNDDNHGHIPFFDSENESDWLSSSSSEHEDGTDRNIVADTFIEDAAYAELEEVRWADEIARLRANEYDTITPPPGGGGVFVPVAPGHDGVADPVRYPGVAQRTEEAGASSSSRVVDPSSGSDTRYQGDYSKEDSDESADDGNGDVLGQMGAMVEMAQREEMTFEGIADESRGNEMTDKRAPGVQNIDNNSSEAWAVNEQSTAVAFVDPKVEWPDLAMAARLDDQHEVSEPNNDQVRSLDLPTSVNQESKRSTTRTKRRKTRDDGEDEPQFGPLTDINDEMLAYADMNPSPREIRSEEAVKDFIPSNVPAPCEVRTTLPSKEPTSKDAHFIRTGERQVHTAPVSPLTGHREAATPSDRAVATSTLLHEGRNAAAGLETQHIANNRTNNEDGQIQDNEAVGEPDAAGGDRRPNAAERRLRDYQLRREVELRFAAANHDWARRRREEERKTRRALRKKRQEGWRVNAVEFRNKFSGLNAVDSEGRNGFLRAIRSGYGGTTKILLHYLIRHADRFDSGFLDAVDRDQNNALHQAIYRCSQETVELLLRKKSKFKTDIINAPNKNGNTALLLASSFSDPITRLLLQCSDLTSANARNNDGTNAFLRAAAMGRLDICRLLFRYPRFAKDGINDVDNYGNNALLLSAGYGNSGIMNFLTDGEAAGTFKHTLNSMNNKGDTVLIIAGEYGYTEFCRQLVQDPKFNLITHQNSEGQNVLLAAARRGYVGVCEFFVNLPEFANHVEACDNQGNNAFLYACSSFRFAEDLHRVFFSGENHRLRFSKEFYIKKNNQGRNALHLASADGALHVCRFLLAQHSNSGSELSFDKGEEDYNGETAHSLLQRLLKKNRWDKNTLYTDYLRELQKTSSEECYGDRNNTSAAGDLLGLDVDLSRGSSDRDGSKREHRGGSSPALAWGHGSGDFDTLLNQGNGLGYNASSDKKTTVRNNTARFPDRSAPKGNSQNSSGVSASGQSLLDSTTIQEQANAQQQQYETGLIRPGGPMAGPFDRSVPELLEMISTTGRRQEQHSDTDIVDPDKALVDGVDGEGDDSKADE